VQRLLGYGEGAVGAVTCCAGVKLCWSCRLGTCQYLAGCAYVCLSCSLIQMCDAVCYVCDCAHTQTLQKSAVWFRSISCSLCLGSCVHGHGQSLRDQISPRISHIADNSSKYGCGLYSCSMCLAGGRDAGTVPWGPCQLSETTVNLIACRLQHRSCRGCTRDYVAAAIGVLLLRVHHGWRPWPCCCAGGHY
jgi:hypothetical protein